MIQLPDEALPEAAAIQLDQWQQQIDALPLYEQRVAQGKRQFESRNSPRNRTFRQVRATLVKMCCGPRRCGYCEDSAAYQIEHIKPKHLYPDAVFRWENYLYACGPCNGPKDDQFAVFSAVDGTVVEVTRPYGAPVVEPQAGEPVLIDPRRENPLDFLFLDLTRTFRFVPLAESGTQEYERARYTLRILGLNDRDELIEAREGAFVSYSSRLRAFIAERDEGVSNARLTYLTRSLQRMGHPTVWREMQRQRTLIPALGRLFALAPEALEW